MEMELELPDLDASTTGHLVPPGPQVTTVVGMRLGGYARISYARNSEKEASINRQLEGNREWATLHEHEIVAEYVDPNTSAFKDVRRDEFERMLADLDAGVIDGIVCWKLDRLVRNHRDFERFWEIAESRGALFATVKEPIDTTTEIGMLIVRLLVGFARLESVNNSVRTSAAMAEAATNGHLHGMTVRPFGYQLVPAEKADGKVVRPATMEVVTEEADLIFTTAARLLAGEEGWDTLGAVARQWNDAGWTTPSGAEWRTSQVRRLLASGRIAGLREHHGEVVAEGVWPGIIDQATRQRLLRNIEARALKPGRPTTYLLTGWIRCGICKNPMSGANHRAKNHIQYRCPNPAAGGPSHCGKITVAAPSVEELVAKLIARRLEHYQPPEHQDDEDVELQEQLQRDQLRLREIGESFADGEIPRETMIAATERLQARIDATSRRLARSTTVIPVGGADAVLEAWATRSVAWRRQLIGMMIDHIEISSATSTHFNPDRVKIVWAEAATAPQQRPGSLDQ